MSSTIHPEQPPAAEVASPPEPPPWPPTDLISKSLGCIGLDNGFRKWCINASTPNNLFDQFILFCIVANSLVMAMTDYSNIEGMKAANGGTVKEEDR